MTNSEPVIRTTEESIECCPTCGGSGRIEKITERKFLEGQQVIWCAGPHRIPATVVGYSKSGKRVRIKSSRWGSTFVSPLSLREAT